MAIYKEKCSFIWEEFGSSMKESFNELLGNQNFADVTLACEDGQQIEAHKIVLSAGSLFFRNILTKTKHPQPFIYLKGIKKDELKGVMDFLYTGQSTLDKELLESFLEIAQHLQVKGLEINTGTDAVKQEDLDISPKQSKESTTKQKTVDTSVTRSTEKLLYEFVDPLEGKDEDQTSEEFSPKIDEVMINNESETVCKYCETKIPINGAVNGHKEKHTCHKKRKVKVARFLPSWLDMTIQGQSVSTWLAPDPETMSRAICTLCPNNSTFSINEGWKAVKQHYKTVKHQENKIFAKFSI